MNLVVRKNHKPTLDLFSTVTLKVFKVRGGRLFLTYRDKTFLVYNGQTSPGIVNAKATGAGFTFDRQAGAWFSTNTRNAARLREYADESARKEIDRIFLSVSPWSGRVPVPRGLRPLPFQRAAIKFALQRNRCYWWNDMGTGKGPCSAMVTNALASRSPLFVCYVTPPELIFNVEAELKKWLCGKPDIEIFHPKRWPIRRSVPARLRVLILPDTMLGKIPVDFAREPHADVPGQKNFLIVDEADRFKNPDAARTRSLLGHRSPKGARPGVADFFERVLYMSGTALPNGCALELFPILQHSAPETIDFSAFYRFAWKYCHAEKNDFGTRFTGLKNETEFREKIMRPFVFRLKKDALNLPPRIESALVIAADMKSELAGLDTKLRRFAPKDLMRAAIAAQAKKDESALHLMTYRRLLGKEKVAPLIPYIKRILETESVLVGAIHTEVIDLLREKLSKFDPLVIDGRLDKKKRHALIEAFKKDPRPRPLIGNINAMKRGFTILKCSRVLLVEWEWVPGANDQFTDRTHRVGQTKTVSIQYAAFRNSVDFSILQSKLRKRNFIAKAEGGE